MTVAPLIAMKSTKCESLEAVGKELDRRAHTYANDVDQSGRQGHQARGEERPQGAWRIGRRGAADEEVRQAVGEREGFWKA